jgi:hypothetical protein
MNKKNGTKICAMMLVLVFIVQVGAGATRPSSSSDRLGGMLSKRNRLANETQVIELGGSIRANVCNGSGGRLSGIVYPTIDMSGAQALSINTTKDNASWVVNATLRININKPEMTNKSYLIPRCLTVFAVVIRKNQPLISGLLRDLFLGHKFVKINVFNPNSSDYIDIPLIYSTKKQDEEQRVFIFAIGSLMGLFAGAPPIFAMKTIDLSCHYSATGEGDIIPPFTWITLTGDEFVPNVFAGSVNVELQSIDNSSTVVDTQYQCIVSGVSGEHSSGWMEYNGTQTYTEEGDYTFRFYSKDSIGNMEPVKTAKCSVMAPL